MTRCHEYLYFIKIGKRSEPTFNHLVSRADRSMTGTADSSVILMFISNSYGSAVYDFMVIE